MKGRSDIPLILGRLRPSKRLTRPSKRLASTQVLSQCAAMRGGTVQPINFSKPLWAGANIRNVLEFQILSYTALKHLVMFKYIFGLRMLI